MAVNRIYHLARRSDWEAAVAPGQYFGSGQDQADGFIHFSTAEQVKDSAARHRAGEADLLLLSVDATVLGDALKWEASPRSGALFPHLYGPLPAAAVIRVDAVPLGPDGRHLFPALD